MLLSERGLRICGAANARTEYGPGGGDRTSLVEIGGYIESLGRRWIPGTGGKHLAFEIGCIVPMQVA